MATFDEIKSVLYGTETSNRPGKIFTTSFAVPSAIQGKRRDDNGSGISFGSNQLDIGNNDIARRAYERIVNNAFDTGAVSQEQRNQLLWYSGVKRPDLIFTGGLDAPISGAVTLRSDQQILDRLFSTPYARSEIVKATNANIAGQVTPINDRLDRLANAFQNDPNSIFSPTSPDYHTAVAAMIAAYNRSPGLADRLVSNLEQQVRVVPDLLSTRQLTTTPNIETLGELYKRLYDSRRPEGWNLITNYGASNLRDGVTVPDQ